MKSIFSAILAVAFFLPVFAGINPKPIDKQVKVSESSLTWKATKVVGSHEGTIALKSGSLKFDGTKLIGGSFLIDMTTIAVTDLTGGMKDKLQGHLNSDDFFSVEKYNEAKFVITKINKADGVNYNITGDLTIKGITNPITFDAVVMNDSAKSSLKIDRTKFDIKYGSGSFFEGLGDKAIDNEFTLNLELKY